MSSDQMPAPGKTKLIKFPPSRGGKDVKCPARGGGDVEASIWLIHYSNTWPRKRKNAEDISLTSQTTKLVWKGTSTQDPGSSSVFKVLTFTDIDHMVLAQRMDNCMVPKSPQLLMFYCQPLVCRTAQTFLLMALYCSTLPTKYFIALKLSATFMAELTSYLASCYKRLQTVYTAITLKRL